MSRRTKVAATITACLVAAGTGAAAAPASSATPPTNTCGGAISDYTGPLTLDAAFVGTIAVNGDLRPITIAPLLLNSTMVRVDVQSASGDTRSAYGNLSLKVPASGRGKLTVGTFHSLAFSTDVTCASGTRVTKIEGKTTVEGTSGFVPFTVSRT